MQLSNNSFVCQWCVLSWRKLDSQKSSPVLQRGINWRNSLTTHQFKWLFNQFVISCNSSLSQHFQHCVHSHTIDQHIFHSCFVKVVQQFVDAQNVWWNKTASPNFLDSTGISLPAFLIRNSITFENNSFDCCNVSKKILIFKNNLKKSFRNC